MCPITRKKKEGEVLNSSNLKKKGGKKGGKDIQSLSLDELKEKKEGGRR